MNLFFLFLLFFLAAFFSFYIPGALILSYIFPKVASDHRFIAAWGVGIAFFLLLSYVFAWVHVDFLLLFLLIGAAVFAIWKKRSIFYLPKITDWFAFGLLLFGTLSFVAVTFFSGFKTTQGLQFIGVINTSDGLLHIANIKNLLIHFPPTHSAVAGIPLRGYHYFYDLLASRFVLFYHFDPFDLHYRFFALFIALFYGASVYLFSTLLTDKKAALRSILFFAYFAQSAATVVSLFIPAVSAHAELGLVYPIELITNPAILLSVSLFLIVLFLLLQLKSAYEAVVIGVILGVLSEIKVYTGIIGLGVLVIYFFYILVKNKKLSFPHIIVVLVAVILTGLTFFPNNGGSGNLWYSPFFVYSVFMQEPPVDIWQWELRRRVFAMHHNIPHLLVLYLQAFGMFWLLALGSRIIFLFGLPSIVKRKFWEKDSNMLLLLAITIPMVIGSLFVQSVSIFDTKQFFWIAATLLAIPAGIVLGNSWEKLPKAVSLVITFAVVLMSWGAFSYHMYMFLFNPSPLVISKEQLHIFDTVASVANKQSFLVVANDINTIYNVENARALAGTPLISALTGIPVYFEHEPAQYQLDAVYTERQKMIATIGEALKSCDTAVVEKTLDEIGSRYLLTFPPYPCIGLGKRYISSNFAFYIKN